MKDQFARTINYIRFSITADGAAGPDGMALLQQGELHLAFSQR